MTLFGESSGALATCAVLTSPRAAALQPRADAAAKFCCQGTDSAVLACLRRVPVKAWLDGGYTEVFTAAPYGIPVLPASPVDAMREGRTPHVPVLFGTDRDELRLYVAADARALAVRGRPVHACQFADREAPGTQGYPMPPGFPLVAAHGLELASLFGPASLERLTTAGFGVRSGKAEARARKSGPESPHRKTRARSAVSYPSSGPGFSARCAGRPAHPRHRGAGRGRPRGRACGSPRC
ncbi:hypothetical protein [Amycolatopsis saalfeldensis]|uniref:hypothetical protein n=1 Tax=Amycolatopsis saalfeldensis TaxID=394193 RepID=UPI0015A5CB44